MKCIFCGGELCWNNDFTRDEVFGDGDNDAIVGYYTCMTCGREYEVSDPCEEEKEGRYREYWKPVEGGGEV